MAKSVKYITAKEFRDEGYLQELNRQFLHPLGLALEVRTNDKGEVDKIGGVWDYRDDPEGLRYGGDLDLNGAEAIGKAKNIARIQGERRTPREDALGYWVQPCGEG